MNTIEINFKEVVLKDLMSNPVPCDNIHEQLCNVIYKKTGSIRVSDTVRELFYGKSIEADEQILQELLVESTSGFIPMVQDALTKYLAEKLNNLKSE